MANDNKIVPLKSVKDTGTTEPTPTPRTFEFHYHGEPGTNPYTVATGFLMCTPNFVGLGEADGSIVGVFPLSDLRYVVEQAQNVAAA